MVEILRDHVPMGRAYQFSTRREAFDHLLQLEREQPGHEFAITLCTTRERTPR